MRGKQDLIIAVAMIIYMFSHLMYKVQPCASTDPFYGMANHFFDKVNISFLIFLIDKSKPN